MSDSSSDIILFDKNIGIVTPNQIIIGDGKDQKRIDIDSINKVILVKNRVFFTNIILTFISISFMGSTHVFFRDHKVEIYYGLLFIGTLTLLYAIFHKFYIYKIGFMKKKKMVYEFNASQFKKENIKEFYSCVKKVLKQNSEIKSAS